MTMTMATKTMTAGTRRQSGCNLLLFASMGMCLFESVSGFGGIFTSSAAAVTRSVLIPARPTTTSLGLSDWADFQALDDDDDEDLFVDLTDYATEDDSQEFKAEVGSQLEPPSIENDAEPIFVPQGTCN